MTRRTVSGRGDGAAAKRRLLPMLLAVLAVVSFVGLAVVVDWVGTYLVPLAVIIGGVVVSFGLLVWVAGKLDDRWYTLP